MLCLVSRLAGGAAGGHGLDAGALDQIRDHGAGDPSGLDWAAGRRGMDTGCNGTALPVRSEWAAAEQANGLPWL